MTAGGPYPGDHQAGATETAAGASVGQLMSEISSDLSQLIRQEIELAKAEMKAEAKKAGKGFGEYAGAGFAGYMVLVVGTFAIVFAVGSQIGLGWAALIMTVVWAVVGVVLYNRGRADMRRFNPKPETTIETIKENAQWARHPRS